MSHLPFIHADDALAPLRLTGDSAARRELERSRLPQIVTIHDWMGATSETPVKPAGRRIFLATELDRVDLYAA